MFGAVNYKRTDHIVGKNCGVLHGRFVCILDSLFCSEVTLEVCVWHRTICVYACFYTYSMRKQGVCIPLHFYA